MTRPPPSPLQSPTTSVLATIIGLLFVSFSFTFGGEPSVISPDLPTATENSPDSGTLWDSVVPLIEVRPRYEFVEQDGKDDAHASTVRRFE